jgi:hypothetical protein
MPIKKGALVAHPWGMLQIELLVRTPQRLVASEVYLPDGVRLDESGITQDRYSGVTNRP